MTAHLTAAEARKLGIDLPDTKVRVRRTARGAYHTVCKACGEEFRTLASEDRHLEDTKHARYELVWGH